MIAPVHPQKARGAGHGSGKPIDKIIDEYADMGAFIASHTGMSPAQ